MKSFVGRCDYCCYNYFCLGQFRISFFFCVQIYFLLTPKMGKYKSLRYCVDDENVKHIDRGFRQKTVWKMHIQYKQSKIVRWKKLMLSDFHIVVTEDRVWNMEHNLRLPITIFPFSINKINWERRKINGMKEEKEGLGEGESWDGTGSGWPIYSSSGTHLRYYIPEQGRTLCREDNLIPKPPGLGVFLLLLLSKYWVFHFGWYPPSF